MFEIPLGPEDLEDVGRSRSVASQDTVIPVLAEELHVSKQAVPKGGVRVHRRVHEHEEIVDIPLRKESLDVRRMVIEREVDGPLAVRREGETTIIPIVEEELVISKRFVLKEEVHVTRTVREERHRERVTVSRQESEIERVDASGQTAPLDVKVARKPEERPRRPRRRSILE
jgi:uncharacterized protein (TIGR02271 family)